MREINKNMDFSRVTKSDLSFGKKGSTDNQPTAETETESESLKDFSNPTAEALGRSQVSKTDNLKKDADFALENPETIEQADKLFEAAYKKLSEEGDPNAYEKAASIATSEDAKALL